jgi:hypothetical protein
MCCIISFEIRRIILLIYLTLSQLLLLLLRRVVFFMQRRRRLATTLSFQLFSIIDSCHHTALMPKNGSSLLLYCHCLTIFLRFKRCYWNLAFLKTFYIASALLRISSRTLFFQTHIIWFFSSLSLPER